MLVPARVVPPAEPLGRLAFLARFVRNPLDAIPQAVYEQDLVPVGRANPRAVWITSPELVKAVLLDERDKFQKLTQIRLLSPLLGKGVLTSEGADWRWQRRAAAPMVRAPDLGGFVPAFVAAAGATLARWREAPAGSVRPIDDDMTRTTFDVISSTLLPSTDAGFEAGVQRSVQALQRFGGWDILYASLGWPDWTPRPGRSAKRRAIAWLRAAVGGLVRARHAANAAGDAPDDLLQRLIAARDPETGQAMDDSQLVDNVLTFYLAGHETTAKALTWSLSLLAQAPEWAAAIRDEVRAVAGDAPLVASQVASLVVTTQVLKEAIRLYPPAPIMSRQAVVDTTLGGVPIRRGMSVLMPIYAIHRHARRWPDPDAFDPTRFAPGREIPRYQYMPFGAGPRVCIGMSFAMLEATVILATLVRGASFGIVDAKPARPVAQVTLVPEGGLRLRVTPGTYPNLAW